MWMGTLEENPPEYLGSLMTSVEGPAQGSQSGSPKCGINTEWQREWGNSPHESTWIRRGPS